MLFDLHLLLFVCFHVYGHFASADAVTSLKFVLHLKSQQQCPNNPLYSYGIGEVRGGFVWQIYALSPALAIQGSALAVLAVRQLNICCISAHTTSHS